MIPKIIHYCWYGRGELSAEIEMCIDSWKQFCPDYIIKRWDEDNSPMTIPWVCDAYKHQKYAFVADYMRFYALYREGGIYMDTDMLLIQPIDAFLQDGLFLGREDQYNASMGIIGAEANSDFCKMCLDFYDSQRFNMAAPPIITRFITPRLFDYGFTEEDKTQHLTNGLTVYQSSYFYPIHYTQVFDIQEITYPPPHTHTTPPSYVHAKMQASSMNMYCQSVSVGGSLYMAYTYGTSRGLTNCSCLQKGITKRDFVL